MLLKNRRDSSRPPRLRHRRFDLRILFAAVLGMAVLAASTVVSADALRQLPDIWQTIKARPGTSAEPTPARALTDTKPVLQFPSEVSRDAEATSIEPTPGEPTPAAPTFPVSTDNADTAPVARRIVLDPADYAQNWLQAADDVDRQGTIKRTYQVVIGPDGKLQGRIITLGTAGEENQPLADQRVFIIRRGVIDATVQTDADGRFTATGLTTGTCSLVVAGDDSLLAYGFHVLQQDQPVEPADQPIEFTLESAAVTGDDVAAALRRVPTRAVDAAPDVIEIEPDESRIPEGVRAVRQSGVPGTSLRTHRVRQLADGRVIGRVRQLHPETGRSLLPPTTEVALRQNGTVVATARTDEQGIFIIQAVEPGIYALVASTIEEPADDERIANADEPTQHVGLKRERGDRSGFAAFGVEIISPLSLVNALSTNPLRFEPHADEPLALDFALMDAADLWSFTGLSTSSSETSSLAKGYYNVPSSGTKTATSLPRPASQSATNVINNSSGGGGGGFPFPFVPSSSDDDDETMSPSTI